VEKRDDEGWNSIHRVLCILDVCSLQSVICNHDIYDSICIVTYVTVHTEHRRCMYFPIVVRKQDIKCYIRARHCWLIRTIQMLYLSLSFSLFLLVLFPITCSAILYYRDTETFRCFCSCAIRSMISRARVVISAKSAFGSEDRCC
jgi:hypothetical protein